MSKAREINEMSEMHTLQVRSTRIKTDCGARYNPKKGVPKVRSLVQDTGSTVRGVNQEGRQSPRADTEDKQQWPFPTTLITCTGKTVKFNSDNYEGALF